MSEYEAAMVAVLTQIATHLGTLAGIAQRWEATDDAASLRGHVAGERGARSMVVAVPEGAPLRARSALVGIEGAFLLSNLAPGSYRVLAFDRADIEYTNPDVLDRFTAQASQVDLHANDEHTVNLELIHVHE